MKFYEKHPKILLAVDSIIFGFNENERELKLLILKRNFEPAKGNWSLMGGFVAPEESIDGAAERIVKELTGLENVYMEQLFAFGGLTRDPGGRIVSVAYFSLIKLNDYDRELAKKHGAYWISLSELPDLIFDHNEMVTKALRKLRIRARTQPIGFELLPEKFTIPQLQGLYEAIYQTPFDKRNFRRKLLSMNLLEKLDEKEKETSKKGAFYYKFNQEKYEELLLKGFNFEI
ncbi:NUDIX domain-containing protein [Maribellus comscasis]|uniref:NUDIX domain-containing protein n=1 Tax=Maribellus comscasis TaxID=2681766 RepID=A0A6I6JKK8_9BACT|nr:NUDIX domain-containing protein [Maribellus comscasis]QGY43385.1 NUDIX domain-containing protein [Maribellus comscasis]